MTSLNSFLLTIVLLIIVTPLFLYIVISLLMFMILTLSNIKIMIYSSWKELFDILNTDIKIIKTSKQVKIKK